MEVDEKDREIIREIRTKVPNGIMEVKNAYFECDKNVEKTLELLNEWSRELRPI